MEGPTPADAAVPPAPASPPPDHDPGRRAFFRLFGRQAVTTVGQVAGVANMVSQGTTMAAANLIGLGLGAPEANAQRLAGVATPRPGAQGTRPPSLGSAATGLKGTDVHHSPYRLDENHLLLLDQRRVPDAFEEQVCRRGSDVAYYLRVGAARGGPLMAQLAAYGLALSAREGQDRPLLSRQVELKRIRRSLLDARRSSRLLAWAVERMRLVEERLGEDEPGQALAEALWAEADAIASEMQQAQASIAGRLVELLPVPEGRPLSILVHGGPGALGAGQVGAGLAALAQLKTEGRQLLVRVTETRPFLDGARLFTWELRQAGIGHQVVPDSAVAWLLGREPVDAVMVAAEWVAANGDSAGVTGSRQVAELARLGGETSTGTPVPVYVLAPSATIDPGTPDGATIPVEVRPGRELGAFLSGFPADRLNGLHPATDVMPAACITALVTERGIASPVSPSALEELVPLDLPAVGAALEVLAAQDLPAAGTGEGPSSREPVPAAPGRDRVEPGASTGPPAPGAGGPAEGGG